jgi:primosomal protein N' (replication factor Y)
LNYSLIKLKEEVYDYFKPKKIIKIHFYKKINDSDLDFLIKDLKGKKSQQKVVEHLYVLLKKFNPTISELIDDSSVSRATINALIDSGILIKKPEIIDRIQFEFDKKINSKDLSYDQNIAFESIQSAFKEKKVSLLHGVTSSGKTEIYVKLIENQIKKNKQVLYLVPEIALTTQLIGRLKKYFGDSLAVYHSKYSLDQRTEVWKKVLKNDKNARVVIGARSSVFLPFNKLGLIIVDEEHENAFKQFKPAPRYHARDAAIYLAMLHNANTLLGSATPSVETYFNAITNKYGLINLDKRYGGVEPPKIIIKDLKRAVVEKKITGNFSDLLLHKIKTTIENNKQVIIFQNRRGYAPYLECSNCAYVYQCINCDVSLTYHQVSNELKCHHCGYNVENKTICPTCSSITSIKKGLGTQQIVEELGEYFPFYKIERMDHDSTRNKNAFSNIINDFENNKFQILVGTQMLTKGLDFKNVALVGVVNADSLIYFPDFRSQEKCFQLIQQVAGRSGRSKEQGEVIVQTFNPNHQLMKKIIKNDFLGMFNEQLNQRFTFEYPPYSRLIKLTLKHKNLNILQKSSIWLADTLKNKFINQLLGPESPIVSRVNNQFIKNILIKVPVNTNLNNSKRYISKVLKSFSSISNFRNIDILIDVDPYN